MKFRPGFFTLLSTVVFVFFLGWRRFLPVPHGWLAQHQQRLDRQHPPAWCRGPQS
jgi:hypothetical protein